MADNRHHDRSPRESDPSQRQYWQRDRELVLSEYGTWRITADENAPAAEEVRTLETLLRLKAEQLDSPAPGLWTEELATQLLTEVVPRTVIQPREQVMELVPTLIRFFVYLRETGRWHPEAMSPTAAPAMLGGLEFAALEAADDPSRRSFSTNILGYGLSLGVDLEDDRELAAFMHWYNTLPDDDRVTLSSTGRLPAPAAPFDREASLEAAQADRRAATSWPWFLPAPHEPEASTLSDGMHTQDDSSYAESAFVRQAAALLEVIGEDPRKITGTGALNRADSTTVLLRLGLSASLGSMWQRPELAGPWITLLDGGWLEISGDRVHRAAGPIPYVPLSAGGEGFVEFGHAVLTAALFGKDARDGEDGGFRGMPDTIAALLVTCSPDGLSLQDVLDSSPDGPQVPSDPRTGEWDRQELRRLVAVTHDLDALADIGILQREGRHYAGSAAVMVALVALIKDQGEQSGSPLG